MYQIEEKVFYDEEVIKVITEATTPTCIALITGGGKSKSIVEFVKRNSTKRHLAIFSTKKEQENFKEDLDENFKFWNSDSNSSLESALNEFESGCFSITKSKFINLILQNNMEFFENFDYIFYDEFSTLNPCLVSDLINELSEIQKYSKKIFNSFDRDVYNTLEWLYCDIRSRIMDLIYCDSENPLYNRVFKIECDLSYINKAKYILDIIATSELNLPEKDNATNIKISSTILLMLNSIITNRLYVCSFLNKNEVIHNILGVNDMIRDFIKLFKGKFIVMDATADIVKDVYSYLGITIVDDFTKNKNKTYEHVNFNVYEFKDAEAKLIRRGDENSLDIISQAIKDRKIVSFIPMKVKEAFKNNYGYEFEKVYHFFSGDDIGSNEFRDKTEINIIALQTYPRAVRILYNHIIKNQNLETANSSRNDFAEFELLSSHLVQNINRTKSRVYECSEEININLICVPRHIALKASTFMKGSNVLYKTSVNITDYNFKDRIISCISDYLKSYDYKDVIELDTFLIERKFFNTVTNMMNFINNNMIELNKCTLKLGFNLNVKEKIRPYALKIETSLINDEDLISFDDSKIKFLSNFINLKKDKISEISIKNFKINYNINDRLFTLYFNRFQEVLQRYGVYRIGNTLITI